MKKSNIAFSGFMAAILVSVGAANAATKIASQQYVDANFAKASDVTEIQQNVTEVQNQYTTINETVTQLGDTINNPAWSKMLTMSKQRRKVPSKQPKVRKVQPMHWAQPLVMRNLAWSKM